MLASKLVKTLNKAIKKYGDLNCRICARSGELEFTEPYLVIGMSAADDKKAESFELVDRETAEAFI